MKRRMFTMRPAVVLLLVIVMVTVPVDGFAPQITFSNSATTTRRASLRSRERRHERMEHNQWRHYVTTLAATTPSTATSATSFDSHYYTPPEQLSCAAASTSTRTASEGVVAAIATTTTNTRVTLRRFLANRVKENPEFQDLQNILLALELSCKTISNLVNRAGLVYSIRNDLYNDNDGNENNDPATNFDKKASANYSDGRYYSMKRLDKLSTNVLKNALKFTGTVQMIAAARAQMDSEQPQQHQPGLLVAYDENFVACLDPLDGSGNADASICTGTVFGVFARQKKKKSNTMKPDSSSLSSSSSKTSATGSTGTTATSTTGTTTATSSDIHDESELLEAVLQPARNMRAAGYCLYSSATVLVFTLGDGGVYGFTLDPQIQEFVLTHDKLTIPPRGNVYSCNEANSEGWDDDGPWKQYLRNLKLGQGETKTRYAHRYVGSMVGDIHRTLLYGGIFAYPSDKLEKPKGNLQLLYKVAPMAFVVHHAGGKALDEDGQDLLDKIPQRIHQKSPCFMGSPQDIEELERYLKRLPPPAATINEIRVGQPE